MRLFSSLALAAALTVSAMAADWQRGAYDDRGYGRDRYDDRDYRNGGGRGDAGLGALSRVEQDLRYMASRGGSGYYGGGSNERKSLERALKDVERVRNDWQRKGRLDTRRVDSASRHMSEALRNGRMDPRDRSTLSRDIGLLQQLRNGGGIYGNNGGSNVPWRR